MAIAHVETTSIGGVTNTVLTLTGHVVSGANRALVVTVGYRDNGGGRLTSVVWNGSEGKGSFLR